MCLSLCLVVSCFSSVGCHVASGWSGGGGKVVVVLAGGGRDTGRGRDREENGSCRIVSASPWGRSHGDIVLRCGRCVVL